nr:immunoglobulin light chain junction region [Macaca mulatta]MOV99969.1 immunoglobulin light chain junction region [Macaca mulatta]MOW05084.1 immunoglobulin light chain junction region [Macaca mulatta]MOW07386.1 immunoglobulin light chain junction region [Macaca mulatta]MOW15141.1 immunoglobulin light chain junction region [Macaca mulatta]
DYYCCSYRSGSTYIF